MSASKSETAANGSNAKQQEVAVKHSVPLITAIGELLRLDRHSTANHKVLDEIALMGIDRYIDKKNKGIILYEEIYAPSRWTFEDINMVLDEFLQSKIIRLEPPKLVKYTHESDWCIMWKTDLISLSDEKALMDIAKSINESRKFFNDNFENRVIYRGKPYNDF